MSTTTTARKLSYRRSTVAGWEVFDFATEQVVTVVKNREQARAAIKELAALPEAEVFDAAVVMAEQSGLTADQLAEVAAPVTGDRVRSHPVFADLSEEAREVIARNADQVAEHDARAQADAQAAQVQADREDAEADEVAAAQSRMAVAMEKARIARDVAGMSDELAVEQAAPVKAPAKKAAAKKATTPKAPKADKPKGELTVVRKLEDGQRFTLRGVGVVKVVGRVRVEKQKYLVEYEDATGAYGSAEMWANSRLRLV